MGKIEIKVTFTDGSVLYMATVEQLQERIQYWIEHCMEKEFNVQIEYKY